MRAVGPTPLDRRQSPGHPADPDTSRTRRRPVRPLDDGTTELVHVIEFILPAGRAIQPVIFLDRQLLD
ncbi:MAG TPA: hypothetical protein VK867_00010 [Candidatus Limnocylindrales bacterium]|nr:hypothetical protein [Candidatus Limnocylindrales bacterium]